HIGKNVVIEQFVSIYSHVTIGDGSIIRAGATIGCMGFEFKRNDDSIMPIKHFGGVYLDRNIEVQNNTCIDRAVFPWDNTYIGENTKIDNLVHIGHAAKIQKNVLIAAHACIGGRTVIMPNTWVGIGSMIRNGIVIGSNARVNMGAVVTKSVLDNQSVTGNFAIDHQKFMANFKDTL
ncbi:MAG: UDP-3-O-(3-hydroxymyristoyl)glucosamine N-acyltransferase, partial [Clostridiales bacterium]